jgi:hypothetical protein
MSVIFIIVQLKVQLRSETIEYIEPVFDFDSSGFWADGDYPANKLRSYRPIYS